MNNVKELYKFDYKSQLLKNQWIEIAIARNPSIEIIVKDVRQCEYGGFILVEIEGVYHIIGQESYLYGGTWYKGAAGSLDETYWKFQAEQSMAAHIRRRA